MADDLEKTEEPTSKRIEDARKEGNVPKSVDTSGFITLLVAVVVTWGLFSWILQHLQGLYHYYISFIGYDITYDMLVDMTIHTLLEIGMMVMPVALPVALAGLIAAWMQFGFLFTTKPLVPDFGKLNPIKGFKNLFSLKKLIEGVKITLKVGAVFTAAFTVFLGFIEELQSIIRAPLPQQLLWLSDRVVILAMVMLALLLVLAFIDLAFVRYNYFKGLRMSKQEVKDEMKQMEGNPEIKAKIRQKMMEMSRKRMLAEVPNADVVITNPTHFAVALQYKENEGKAPKVVAKGADLVALKIKEIAREHNIQIVENPPLARELYKNVDIEEEIPEQFYQAVAEVLAFVYKANKKI
ncbi:flagellar biosynthesis protein FlhB [Hydrogenimonas thermophila]|uniref:Flagellar biosynthetic protein FlhB n=1 Tax=Hydrogenimonas thermophila TaxID=223786 RepID=A0A1I5SWI6_9BACT|nr:flagellar biosynthesis protein FlhB [Hydrogenimonas thermophila]WOE70416.1 flagellar biosynthesis protein FlhB [Hydrogenimonas thermophila]WOE72931.1 flagellar biosynthesis protein FlhB [Hydrogenimonas thermophila]SFP75103.1 flagellar biosynthetic protein FlhB [Hydrogenimonas thermophila]